MSNTVSITHGPWLSNADIGRITISFVTDTPCAASVELRLKGEETWKKIYQTRGGQAVGKDTKHIFHLKNLQPGKEYEYKVAAFQLFREEEKVERTGCFTVFSEAKKEYTFLVLADLQFSMEKRDELIRKYYALCHAEKCDFIVSLGDMISELRDFEENALKGMIDIFCTMGADRIPLVLLRGNHEMRGADTWMWNDYFASPEGNSYMGFRHGCAAFLGLDSWADQKGGGENPIFHYNDDENFIREEKEFVDKEVKKSYFRDAPFRIVLSHGATNSHIDQFNFLNPNLRYMTDDHFRGAHPKVPLHLWICGHIHHYIRTIPLKAEYASIGTPYQPIETPQAYSYPTVTTDGPPVAREFVPDSGIDSSVFLVKVTEGYLEVKAIAEEIGENGGLIDHFRIYKDRKVEELFPIAHHKWEEK